MEPIIIVSTHNRRDLTGITLDAIMACKWSTTPVWVVDDHSTEYDDQWLMSFGVERVVKPSNIRTFDGRYRAANTARFRLQTFLESGKDVGILFDNDALVVPGFESEALCMGFQFSAALYPEIGTLYRSCLHPAKDAPPIGWYDELEHCGGISLVVTPPTAELLLEKIEWNGDWDWQLHNHAKILAPELSFVEHIGRHGSGVNGQSNDRALNFIGYGHRIDDNRANDTDRAYQSDSRSGTLAVESKRARVKRNA